MIKEDECIACSLYDHGTDVTVIPPKTRNDVVASELYGTVIGLGATRATSLRYFDLHRLPDSASIKLDIEKMTITVSTCTCW